jgi:acetyl esterase/lipase
MFHFSRHLRVLGAFVLAGLVANLRAQDATPFPMPSGKKGLQVQMTDDALALGIQHATLNCDLTPWPALTPQPSDPRWTAADGREYAFRAEQVAALDRQVQPLSHAGVLIYLILLARESGEPARDAIMLHPHYDRAAKTNRMAAFNTVTPEGIAWLRATAEFIAARYCGDSPRGRVWGYIVGNEVNSHWWWYNLGHAPLETVAQEYEHAVRLVHTAVRRHSANARVYLSFEHHWSIRYPPGGGEQSVPGRDLLAAFARCAREGGDYDWHVAFHPYPENLGNPRVWLDQSATPGDDSPRITFKNMEVLTRHLSRPELLWRGQPRRVILSEQGLHCPEDLPDGERLQAAGFAYAWVKANALDGIDAFILHRHVDHAHEGLNLGLWTHKPGTISEPDRHRPLYEVFRAAGTAEEARACAFALPIIGVKDWAEVTASTPLRPVDGRTPETIPLWPDRPPKFLENSPPETVDVQGRIRMISVPSITAYLPPPERRTGMAILVCPGGGYGAMDWKTHVVYTAEVFNAKGIAVIGLKYRTRPPHSTSNAGIQELALLDGQRAVRIVRERATEWQLDPHRIGVAGYSAGANLTMNLAANFDAGDPQADDPIERQSCRPDFVVGLATWHWREKTSPFRFRKDSPPAFLVHATNDGLGGGAPIELPRAIEAQLQALGVPVRLAVFDEGGHGVGNLIPQRVKNGFPPAKWPELLLDWLASESVKASAQ